MLNHIPTREKIAELVIAVLENSNDLLVEAMLLFDHQRYSRSFTLSQICLEELAKAKLFMDALYCISQEYFIERLEVAMEMKNSHRLKLAEALTINFSMEMSKLPKEKRDHQKLLSFTSNYTQGFEEIEDYNRKKNNSLYVDLKDGKIIKPEKEITIKETKMRLDKATTLNAWCRLEYYPFLAKFKV